MPASQTPPERTFRTAPQCADAPGGRSPGPMPGHPAGTGSRPGGAAGSLLRAARASAPALASAVCGLCLYASFAPLRWWFLAPVGVAVLVAALRGRSPRAAFGTGFLAGLAFFGLLVDWASESTGTWVARAGLGAVLALYTAAMALVWRGLFESLGDRPLLLAPALATVWVAVEQLRGAWPLGGMPWGTLAFGQVDGPLLRLAPYGSSQAVGFAVVAAGVLLEAAVRVARRGGKASAIGASACCLAAAGLVFGPLFLPLPPVSAGTGTVAVGFVQGRIPAKSEVSGRLRALTVTENLAAATRRLEGRGADLVLWPESASDLDAHTDPDAGAVVEEASRRLGVPLLLGTQRYPGDYRYNDYIAWLPDRGPSGRYTKQHPVPFGEYMPARGFFRLFTSAVDQIYLDMRAGSGPALLDVNAGGRRLRVAVPICFEIGYEGIVNEAVRKGAQFIAVPTNNASFGHSAESRQQFDMTRFLSAETGRTAIQVSTVGVSGVAEPDGRVHHMTEPWRPEARLARVALRSGTTPATRVHGYATAAFYLAGAALGGLALAQGLNRPGGNGKRREKGGR